MRETRLGVKVIHGDSASACDRGRRARLREKTCVFRSKMRGFPRSGSGFGGPVLYSAKNFGELPTYRYIYVYTCMCIFE